MGTRCLTVFMDGEKEIAVLYRQFDGYPDGHGIQLAQYLSGKKIVNGLTEESNVFNGMGCLAASVVAHFKKEPGGFYLHPAGTRNVWEDYVYTVSGAEGDEPKISVDDFSGTASDFVQWITKVNEV